MTIQIRSEEPPDIAAIDAVTVAAFLNAASKNMKHGGTEITEKNGRRNKLLLHSGGNATNVALSVSSVPLCFNCISYSARVSVFGAGLLILCSARVS